MSDARLPKPPGDEEKYWYLGRQHRWLVLVQALSYVGVGISLLGFARLSYWSLIALLPLLIYTVELCLAFRTTLFKRVVSRSNHDRLVQQWAETHFDDHHFPSVDVYLPTAGEPLEVLDNTYGYVGSLIWPGQLNFYVLDDAGRSEVRDLADLHGFRYIHRVGSEFKKAGNLNNAFKLTDGELILLFDADFVPRPEMLLELVPYMDDPSTGIVQSPQTFDTDKNMGWLERGAGATQELFYRSIQASRDSIGAAICVGTSALYRRSALALVDGFPLIDHSEDMYTGIMIKNHGYVTRYIPVILTKGTCPDALNSFVMQQYRWCEGSLHMLTDPAFHLNRKLTISQRMSFWAGILYYLSTAMNAFLGPLPILVMLIWFPGRVQASNMLLLLGPVILWLIVYPMFFRYRWRLEVLRVQLVYSYTHAVTFWHMLQSTKVEWVPTGGSSKATPLATTVRQLLRYYLGSTQLALIALLILDTVHYGMQRYWLTVVFVVLNLYVTVPVIFMAFSAQSSAVVSDQPQWWRRFIQSVETQQAETKLAPLEIPVETVESWSTMTVYNDSSVDIMQRDEKVDSIQGDEKVYPVIVGMG